MKGKRILSAVLSAALLLQLSPLAAFAEDTAPLPDTTPAALTEAAEPELLAAPTPEVEEEPTPEPSAEPTAEPVVEDTALLTAEPTETPTPDPTEEPTAAPAEETPAPESTAAPTPEPTAEPTASPDPAEQVQALIDALPDADAVTGDTADEVEAQLTAIDDAKASLTDEQLAGLDYARYDAAANALLALWGEAPTDEVETLDSTYAEPEQDSDGFYKISNENDLRWFAQAVNSGDSAINARLKNDITVDKNTPWTPIGTASNPFTGVFDGGGHTISGLNCNTPDSNLVGLFGRISGGTVSHLGVVDSSFTGNNYVGGVCGYNQGTISGCYSTASVNSNKISAGVLVGSTTYIVKNCFAYGTAQGSASPFGVSSGTTTNCFYLSTTSDDGFWTGKAGATAEQFKSGEVAYLLGLQDSIWKQAVNSDPYPNFTAEKSVGYANGSYHNHDNADDCNICNASDNAPEQSGGVYQIATAAELKWFATTVNSGNSNIKAILLKDITVTGWTPIGTQTNAFTGTLNGSGYTVTINGMANETADYAGLVGYLDNFGNITNIKVAGTVTGGSNVGGVVGYCKGTLQNVINAAAVSGTSNVGGVAGYMSSTRSSYNLGNTGEVTGGSAGGLVGTMAGGGYVNNGFSTKQGVCGTLTQGSFTNCYDTVGTNATIVSDTDFTGGKVAYLLHQGSMGDTWGQNLATETAPNCLNNSLQVFENANKDGYHNHTGGTCSQCPTEPPQDENGVYRISTAQQLFGFAKLIAEDTTTSHAKAILTNNIVVTDLWTPICNYRFDFQGELDGQGYSITLLGDVGSTRTQYHDLCTGLFAETGNEAVIQNLTVIGNFTATSGYVGAIVGSNSGTVKNCRVINSTVSRGGALVGSNNGMIQNCYSLVQDLPLARDAGKIINSYYLGSNTADATAATSAQFQSGEIAMKLAAGNTDSDTLKWGQKIGEDDYPILGGATVYCFEGYYHNHSGSCAACDEEPTKNPDGAYVIENYAHLLWFAKLVNGTLLAGMPAKPTVNAVLTADNITVDGNWSGIGTENNAYGGTFNGNGHTVTLTGTQATLFVTTSTDAKLNAICVLDGYLTTTDSATVTNCYRPEQAALFYEKTAGSAANCYTLGKLAEQAGSSANFTNCYQVETPVSATGIAATNETAFTGGEVAYKLANGDSKWGQTLGGSTTYPVYGGKAVYFNNTDKYHNHDSAECTHCNSKPKQDDKGWYIIYDASELKWFAKWVNGEIADESGTQTVHPGANAKLGANITLNESLLNENGEPNTGITHEEWTPIGGTSDSSNFTGTPFTGTFDGQGNTISGLYFSDSNKYYVGLFACVGANGKIKNVKITDSYVYGHEYVGLLCGSNSGGTISGCTVGGTVKGSGTNGGVCGSNTLGTVQNCTSIAAVTATGVWSGGICGDNSSGTVTDCSNSGTVSGTGAVGGICGFSKKANNSQTPAQISGCTNTGNVTGTGEKVGGVCGINDTGCIIENSHSTNAEVVGKSYVGGICGCNYSNITNCTASGNVSGIYSGSVYAGGICGENNAGAVQGCTSDCTVTGANGDYTGGICGYNQKAGIVKNCHNSGTVTGKNDVGGVCGYNTVSSTIENCDNKGEVRGTNVNVGGVCGYNTGSSTIKTCDNQGKVTGDGGNVGGVCGKNYTSTVQGSSNSGTVNSDDSGSVGGICGYNTTAASSSVSSTIENCTNTGNVTGKDEVGGVCGSNRKGGSSKANPTIENCTNTGNITGHNTEVGGVCGENYTGTVKGSSNTGNVTGDGERVGGVCGYNTDSSTLQECYNNQGTVSGNGYSVGGVCGENSTSSTIQECYNTGDVTGLLSARNVGGVCGYHTGTIVQDCYNTGAVSSAYSNAFIGGVCGNGGKTVTRCYNTGVVSGSYRNNTICGGNATQTTYCYSLKRTDDEKLFGSGTGTNCEAKTELQFRNGEVAYLLQTAAGNTPTWGQTIGVNQSPVLQWQTDYKKVYPTAEDSPCTGYSNTNNDSRDHEYKNGKCIYCGEKQPTQIAYTVTIPATVELGDKATIKATDVTLPTDKQLNVKIGSNNSKFEVTLDDDTREYTVNNGTVTSGSTVLIVNNSATSGSAELTFNTPESTTYSGTYQGTVTFTVSVDDKSTS